MHLFKVDDVVYLRYKNAASYDETCWMPRDKNGNPADGIAPVGYTPFNCLASQLPLGTPGLEEFKTNWDADVCKEAITGIRSPCRGAEYISHASLASWEAFFSKVPKKVEDVSPAKTPTWWLPFNNFKVKILLWLFGYLF